MGSLKHFYVVLSIPFVFAVADQGLSCINGDVKRLDTEKFLSCAAGTWEQITYKENDPLLGENLNRTRRKAEDVSTTIENGRRSKQKRVFPKKCGFTNVTPDSTIEKTPWLVSLIYRDSKFFGCIGVIISKAYVLTSAYCAYYMKKPNKAFCIVAGDVNLQERRTEYNITQITFHPDFKNVSIENDIALIEISGKFTFSNHIQPICMPYHELYKINRLGVFTAWFVEKPGSDIIGLHRTINTIIGKEECKKKYYESEGINAGKFCTTGRSIMFGIQGGPFFVNEGVRHYLLGLYYVQCDVQPMMYTKVISYMGWIKDVITGVKSGNKII